MIRRLVRRMMLLLILAGLALWLFREWYPRRFPSIGGGRHGRSFPERLAGVRVAVDPRAVWVDDGDTIRITWPDAPRETVRVLGIDAPEIRHPRNRESVDQPYGRESLEFARRRILQASRLELLRASHRDRFQRTLGYLFVDGLNYSVLAIESHLAEATVDRFGDSGFPREAAEVRAAARRAGPMPFESPALFRERTGISTSFPRTHRAPGPSESSAAPAMPAPPVPPPPAPG
jgi:micrococcal nuclease